MVQSADHEGLDPETDVPDAIGEIVCVVNDDHPKPPAATEATPTVRIEVAPGGAVEVIYEVA